MNPESSQKIEHIEGLIAAANELNDIFTSDPHRPRYHFMPPWAWINDINGSLFWKGRYHLFYQSNPKGAYHRLINWGHASSIDLIHWVHHPIAFAPTPGGPDRDGCYSGGALISKEGIPTFIYHGLPDGTCIASSEDDLLIDWSKHAANPVIPSPKNNNHWRQGNRGDPGEAKYVVFDPCAWLEGDTYYGLIGNRIPGRVGDGTALFKSEDLVDWEYVGPFYGSRREWTDADEDCAVPDFFPLGDRHMLLYCTHLFGTQYYIGRLEGEKFYPDTFGRMSWPGGHLGGPRTLLDEKRRRIFFDWIRDTRAADNPDRERYIQRDREAGWSGVISLPRILSLADDRTLRIEPAPEIEMLRMGHTVLSGIEVGANEEIVVEEINGNGIELAIEFEPGALGRFGIKVCCSPEGQEATAIICDRSENKLIIDLSRSSLDKEIQYFYYRNRRWKRHSLGHVPDAQPVIVQEAPFALAADEPLKLRIFLDRSVLEVFANDRQCISQRIYPVRTNSLGLRLFAGDNDVKVKSIEAWDMAPVHY